MDVQALLNYFQQYGIIFIFAVVFLEYLNLPGFPAGVIMPLAGFWASGGKINILLTILVTVAAGLAGSLALYFAGRAGGQAFLGWFYKKFPRSREKMEKYADIVERRGSVGVFIAKLIPMIRTLVSIPAGVVKMNLAKYTVSSALGVLVWNTVFVGAGYFAGEAIFGTII